MKKVEITVYKFDELSENTQSSLIEKELNYRYNDYFYLNFWLDCIKEQAEKNGFNDIDVTYSLSNCQGDGLSFSCSDFELKDFLLSDACKDLNLKDSQIDILLNYCNLEINKNNGWHSFCSRNDVEFLLDRSAYNVRYNFYNIESLCEQIQEKIQDLYLSLCGDFERQGYKELEYYYSENTIKEYIQENDYLYFESGEVYE